MGRGLGAAEGIRGERVDTGSGRARVGIRESGARLMRACAGTVPPGTEVNGRASRVHDLLGRRLASARYARGAPPHVPSAPLPAARAPSLTSSHCRPLPKMLAARIVGRRKIRPARSAYNLESRRSQARRAGGAGSGPRRRRRAPRASALARQRVGTGARDRSAGRVGTREPSVPWPRPRGRWHAAAERGVPRR